MTVRDALQEAYATLRTARADTPVLDATVLLAEALGVRKERLLADLPETLPEGALAVFRRFLDMRLRGIPVSYIRRRKEFWGLEFEVDERVLVPRPETELLVETAVAAAREAAGPVRLHDACTGSGCVAIACAHELRELDVSVSDLSPDALEVCRSNARRLLGRELDARVSDLLAAVPGPFEVVTANPPYLTDDEVARMRAAGWPEPVLALAGGPDGTDAARRLIPQALERLVPGGSFLMEIAPAQADELGAELERAGFREVRALDDLSGRARLVVGRAAA